MALVAGMIGCASAESDESTVGLSVSASAGVTLADITLTGVVPGADASGSDTNFAVNSNAGFTLAASTTSTNSGTDNGMMTKSDAAQLHSPLQVKWDDSTYGTAYVEMTGDSVPISTGSPAANSYDADLLVKNPIAWNDAVGTYSIILTVTASPS